jgi:hypothetical protein
VARSRGERRYKKEKRGVKRRQNQESRVEEIKGKERR